MNIFGVVSETVADLPLRHLLFVAGAAATAAGIYYYIHRDDGGETTAEPEDTTVPEDSVCEQATVPALEHTEVQDQMTAEEKIQELVVSKTQLEDRVKELEELLCEARRHCDLKNKECEREKEAHSNLQAENNEMKIIITQLEEENDETLSNQEELMNEALAEAEEKHQKDVETIIQLEKEKDDLTERVEALKDTVKKTKDLLNDNKRKFDDILNVQDRQSHSNIVYEMDEMQENIAELVRERFDQTIQMENQKNKLKDLGNLVFDISLEIADLRLVREREQEAHSILQAEYDEMKKEQELLKVTLAEAEEKHQKDEETITDLKDQVEILKDTVEEMGKELLESNRECDELMDEQEAHSIHQSEISEMKKTITQLEEKNSEMKKTHKEQLLKEALAEAEEKHQKDEETITQLEKEKDDLTNQVKILRDTVEELGNELVEANRKYHKLMDKQNLCPETSDSTGLTSKLS